MVIRICLEKHDPPIQSDGRVFSDFKVTPPALPHKRKVLCTEKTVISETNFVIENVGTYCISQH